MPAEDKEVLIVEPWAAWIGLATLVLVMGVAIFTAWDRAQTGTLDTVTTPTAVGDTHYIHAPAGGSGPIGLKYQGQLLSALGDHKIRDATLIRADMDDSGVYSLYRPEDEKSGLPGGHFYMKVKADDFIEVTSQ
jgi:hypothetical protein